MGTLLRISILVCTSASLLGCDEDDGLGDADAGIDLCARAIEACIDDGSVPGEVLEDNACVEPFYEDDLVKYADVQETGCHNTDTRLLGVVQSFFIESEPGDSPELYCELNFTKVCYDWR